MQLPSVTQRLNILPPSPKATDWGENVKCAHTWSCSFLVSGSSQITLSARLRLCWAGRVEGSRGNPLFWGSLANSQKTLPLLRRWKQSFFPVSVNISLVRRSLLSATVCLAAVIRENNRQQLSIQNGR